MPIRKIIHIETHLLVYKLFKLWQHHALLIFIPYCFNYYNVLIPIDTLISGAMVARDFNEDLYGEELWLVIDGYERPEVLKPLSMQLLFMAYGMFFPLMISSQVIS